MNIIKMSLQNHYTVFHGIGANLQAVSTNTTKTDWIHKEDNIEIINIKLGLSWMQSLSLSPEGHQSKKLVWHFSVFWLRVATCGFRRIWNCSCVQSWHNSLMVRFIPSSFFSKHIFISVWKCLIVLGIPFREFFRKTDIIFHIPIISCDLYFINGPSWLPASGSDILVFFRLWQLQAAFGLGVGLTEFLIILELCCAICLPMLRRHL